MTGRQLLRLLTGAVVATLLNVCFAHSLHAATQTVDVFPSGLSGSPGVWSTLTGCSNHWDCVNVTSVNRNANIRICSAANSGSITFNAGSAARGNNPPQPMPNVQQGVTSISAEITGSSAYKFGDLLQPTVGINIYVNGSGIGGASSTWDGAGSINILQGSGCNASDWAGRTTTMGAVSASVGDEWTQSQIDSLQFVLARSGSTSRGVRVNSMYASLNYVTYSTLTQNGYRFYQNANSVTPGAALGSAASTPVDFNRDMYGNAFRLRTAIQTTNERWLRQYGTYKLQYANKGTGACAAPTGAWTDVGTGDIQWQANAAAANGADIAVAGGEPTGTMTPQRYQSANPFSKRQQVVANSYGLWDFSLRYAGSSYGNSYCFRVVNSDGNTQPLSGYTNYPEIRITGDLSMAFVNASGTPIGTPSVPFSGLTAMAACQTSTGMLGTNTERLRITDNRGTGNWTISIAASGGSGAKWNSGLHQYSFNDSAGTPPGCANGQLSLSFATIGALPQSGCTATGLAPGSDAAFTAGTPITIGTGTNADRFCYWDITGIGLSQRIPASTPPGSYSLGTTITVIAV